MNEAEYQALLRKPAIAKRNPAGTEGLCAVKQEPTERLTLDRPAPRESESGIGPVARYRVVYTVYAVRPCDWDGYHIKELQDMLVHAGFLFGDEWNILEGSVISKKVHSKEEEGTVVDIIPI